MQLPISYNQVKSRYPTELAEIVRQINSTKAGKKTPVPGRMLKWEFDWCVMIEGDVSFEAILNGEYKEPPELTIEEELKDYERRCGVSLEGHIGHRRASVLLSKVPQEILDQHRVQLEKNAVEKERVAALTPLQRQEEVTRLVRELSKDPGFFVLGVPQEPK